MESGGKKTDGRGYELWVVATSLLGQLPTDEEDGETVLCLMRKLFEEFKKNPIHNVKQEKQDEKKPRNGAHAILEIVQNGVKKPD